MRPPTPIPPDRIKELEEFRKKKWPGNEFQRFLCVWLRVEHGMSTADIARVLNLHVNTVRFTQKDFIDNGVLALIELKRGGRKRSLMSSEDEAAFLSRFDRKGDKGELLVINEIKVALEKHLGQSVHKTTVYRMLHRHGWRKLVPRPAHPKRSEQDAEAFKKKLRPKA
jgi:transposase